MTHRYKLIVGNKGKALLYDLVDDPAETQDLAEDNPQLVKELSGQLMKWQASVEVSLTGADY